MSYLKQMLFIILGCLSIHKENYAANYDEKLSNEMRDYVNSTPLMTFFLLILLIPELTSKKTNSS